MTKPVSTLLSAGIDYPMDGLVKLQPFKITSRLAVMSFLILLACLGCSGDGPPKNNVILIVSDTLRADYLGCYDFPLNVSPNIDELADRGALFEYAMSTSPHTAGAHATLMTGTYPTTHRVMSNYGMIPSGLETLADVLRAEGYETGAIVSNPVLAQFLLDFHGSITRH